jgi:hypothetical protein
MAFVSADLRAKRFERRASGCKADGASVSMFAWIAARVEAAMPFPRLRGVGRARPFHDRPNAHAGKAEVMGGKIREAGPRGNCVQVGGGLGPDAALRDHIAATTGHRWTRTATTNPPEVTEIVLQRLIDTGFEFKSAERCRNAGGTTRWVRKTW